MAVSKFVDYGSEIQEPKSHVEVIVDDDDGGFDIEAFKSEIGKDIPWRETEKSGIAYAMDIIKGKVDSFTQETRSVRSLNLVGVPHVIKSFMLSESSGGKFDNGFPIFAAVEAKAQNGKDFSYNIGGPVPVAQIIQLFREQEIGQTPVVIDKIETPKGDAYRYKKINAG